MSLGAFWHDTVDMALYKCYLHTYLLTPSSSK